MTKFKVGDRVRFAHSHVERTVLAIDGVYAWTTHRDNDGAPVTVRLTDLRHVAPPPEPPTPDFAIGDKVRYRGDDAAGRPYEVVGVHGHSLWVIPSNGIVPRTFGADHFEPVPKSQFANVYIGPEFGGHDTLEAAQLAAGTADHFTVEFNKDGFIAVHEPGGK